MHCNPEFIKQVFPKFLSPTFPILENCVIVKVYSSASDSA